MYFLGSHFDAKNLFSVCSARLCSLTDSNKLPTKDISSSAPGMTLKFGLSKPFEALEIFVNCEVSLKLSRAEKGKTWVIYLIAKVENSILFFFHFNQE